VGQNFPDREKDQYRATLTLPKLKLFG